MNLFCILFHLLDLDDMFIISMFMPASGHHAIHCQMKEKKFIRKDERARQYI